MALKPVQKILTTLRCS